MAFTVEDETGLATANAYISVAEFEAYWDDRGFVHSSYNSAAKQTAIIKATDYIENRYRTRFKGSREFNETQNLSFPRVRLYDEDGNLVSGLPKRLKYATAEYAKRALIAELAPDPTVDDTGQRVVRKREKVGPIEEETQYVEAGAINIFKPYPAADLLLQEYIAPAGRTMRA